MRTENLVIREISDTAELMEVLRLLKVLDQEAELTLDAAVKIWEEMKLYPYYKTFAAFDEKHNVLGTFTLLICINFGHGGKLFAVVENVAVNEAYRRQGIGKAMMEKAMLLAKENGCYKLMLSSDIKRENAHLFYDSLGFARHGLSFRTELRN